MLIGITGKAKSGKDTLASILYANHEFTVMSFAGPLKQGAAIAFGEDWEEFMTQEGKAETSPIWGITRRKMLQDFGEALCEKFGDDFWIHRWYQDYVLLEDTDDVVIADVRKDIEAEAIRALGGFIIHLHREGAGLTGEEGKHKTEQGVTPRAGDVRIDNDGTIEALGDAIELILDVKETSDV